MEPRKVPLRKCVVCQEIRPKKELVRVVRTQQDEVLLDKIGKKSGRGAYLCGKSSCFKLAYRSRALDRALKHQVSADTYKQLTWHFTELGDELCALKGQNNDDK